MKRLFYFILCLLFIIAIFLRLYHLSDFPSINQDELSNIYDGKAILETGADRSGIKHPFVLRAYGNSDYRPALFAWLSAGTHFIFGYSVWSGRFVSVFLSLISLLLLFQVAMNLFGKWWALLTLFIAILTPWHFEFARLAHEGTVLPAFFLILTLFLWIRIKKSDYQSWVLISIIGLELGFSANAYQATKLTAFCVLPLICLDILLFSPQKLRTIIAVTFFWIIGASPQIYILFTDPIHFSSRAADTIVSFNSPFLFLVQTIRNGIANFSIWGLLFYYGKS